MSGSVNKVILIGRLGKDPEIKYTQSGAPVANFSLATEETWKGKDGQQQKKTEWHRIVCWNKLAEVCAQYLAKGRQCYVEGKLQTRQWDDKDGNKRYTTEIVALGVTFLDGKDDGKQSASSPGNSPVERATVGGPATSGSGQDSPNYGPPPALDDSVPF